MNTDQNLVMQRELFIIGLLPRDITNQIGAKINKGLEGLREDAAQYIYNTLLSTIDETIDEKDRKNRIRALELLAKVCKVGATDEKTEVHINFGFSFSDEDENKELNE